MPERFALALGDAWVGHRNMCVLIETTAATGVTCPRTPGMPEGQGRDCQDADNERTVYAIQENPPFLG